MTCCTGFQNLLDNAGQRGVSALARRTTSGIRFLLQSRGIAFEDESKIPPMPADVVLNILCDIGLRFCPFCGQKLQKLVETSMDDFQRLAVDHEKFHDTK